MRIDIGVALLVAGSGVLGHKHETAKRFEWADVSSRDFFNFSWNCYINDFVCSACSIVSFPWTGTLRKMKNGALRQAKLRFAL